MRQKSSPQIGMEQARKVITENPQDKPHSVETEEKSVNRSSYPRKWKWKTWQTNSSPSCLLVVCHCVSIHSFLPFLLAFFGSSYGDGDDDGDGSVKQKEKGSSDNDDRQTAIQCQHIQFPGTTIYYFMASNEKLIKIYFIVFDVSRQIFTVHAGLDSDSVIKNFIPKLQGGFLSLLLI